LGTEKRKVTNASWSGGKKKSHAVRLKVRSNDSLEEGKSKGEEEESG